MFRFLTLFVVVSVLGGRTSAQISEAPVRTHEVLSKTVNYNQVEQLYDNDLGTPGAFFSSSETTAEVRFDLGKNHIIDHVTFTIKRKEKAHNISLLVGNLNNGNGGLLYVCERPDQSIEVYKCQPECRTSTVERPGIIARTFIMRLLVSSNWISVYDMKVYASPLPILEDISSNRLVLPSNCLSRSWVLTDRSISTNMLLTTTTDTNIYFEKHYVITDIEVQFEQVPPQTLKILMINDRNKENILVINLSDCFSQKFLFTCNIKSIPFASRYVKITTLGLKKIFIKGKPVFFPKLELKTSSNIKENLKMTCEYNSCDLSVHSDCSEETIKSGMQFDCVNKRLIRMPSGLDLDSYVIVNHGKVESAWKSTHFSVVSNSVDYMSISMPRSYQYFGQYKCACIVADKMNTEIFSEVTQLKEVDFLEGNLFFEISTQYKLSDNEETPYNTASKNIIYLSKSNLESPFLTVKLTMFSLLSFNAIHIKYQTGNDFEMSNIDRSSQHSVKAFDYIPQSWYISTNKYVADEIFPDFNHESGISIHFNNSHYQFKQDVFIRMLDEEVVKLNPTLWSTNDNKTIEVNVMYASTEEAKLFYLEQSCATTNKSVLATIENSQCITTDSRLVCSNFNNAYLLTFKDQTNFAKKVVLDLRTTKTNKTLKEVLIKSDVVLNQEDVIINHRYISVASSVKNKNISTVRVDINILSKKIYDFIPCGIVVVKIKMHNKDKQDLILQKSNFFLDMDMETKEIMVTIEVTIDGAKGSHVSKLKIFDPTTFNVEKIELQKEDKALSVLWYGIDDVARDVLKSYELKIVTTILACNSTTTIDNFVPKSQTSRAKNRYQIGLDALSQKHMIDMTVTIQPVFINNKKAQAQMINRKFNKISQSTLSIDDVQLTTERTLTVIPSQSNILCDIKEVQFHVIGINVDKFQWKAVSMDKMKYKITNLVPGRKYQLTAKVIYKYGPEDVTSKLYTFETADDISIVNTKHVAQLNERVNISCTAHIGPDDKFKKTVEWLRADKSGLPDGVKSEISSSNPRVAFLIMDKALADYSGEYGCFARPSANTGSLTISIVVNDLVVSPKEQQVDFSKKDEKVSVTCSSSAVGKSKVVWVDPLGVDIPEGDSEKYSLVRVMTEQNVDKSTLTIKSLSLATSGIYKCHKSVGDIRANKEFLLYGNEKLRIETLPMNSSFVGGKRQLRCIADAAIKTQYVVWDFAPMKDDVISLINTSYPNPLDRTIQDIEITNNLMLHQVICKLLPSVNVDREPILKSFKMQLQSKIVVKGPSEVNVGDAAQLLCLGYPDSRNMKLEWIFYSKNTTKMGDVVKVSEDTSMIKSHEPLKLELNLINVKQNEAGRYECKFKSEFKVGVPQNGKSISLVVNALSNPVAVIQSNDNSKKSAPSVMCSAATVLFTVLSMITVRFSC